MDNQKVFAMEFSRVYPLLVAKAERKGRTQQEVDQVIGWLTGYTPADIARAVAEPTGYGAFFENAPAPNPNRTKITGSICGVKLAEIEDPPHAGDPVPGQAGGRAGQGQTHGEDPPHLRTALALPI